MAKDKKQIKSNDTWLMLIVYIVLLTVIIAFACSCSPQRQIWRLEQKHPELLLQYCDSKAVRDTQVINTPGYWIMPDSTLLKYTEGRGYYLKEGDTLKIDCPIGIMPADPSYNVWPNNSVFTQDTSGKLITSKEKAVSKNKKDNKPIYVPPTKTIIIHTVDTSGKALLRSENSRITEANNTLQGKLSTWQFWAILGYVIAIALAVGIGFLIKWK